MGPHLQHEKSVYYLIGVAFAIHLLHMVTADRQSLKEQRLSGWCLWVQIYVTATPRYEPATSCGEACGGSMEGGCCGDVQVFLPEFELNSASGRLLF